MPANYKDSGSNTLAACFATGKLQIPNMQKMGLYQIDGVTVGQPVEQPAAAYGRMAERSAGKDTTTGHWELMGLVSQKPMPTYPNGFPKEVLDRLSQETGRGILCNLPYSGTQVTVIMVRNICAPVSDRLYLCDAFCRLLS